MAGLVSVVIVNWNGRRYLEGCLSSVLSQTYPHFEVILVDNGSTDSSVEFVSQTFPQIRLIENHKNMGFAAGSNMGIKVAKGDYIATINNDAQADRRWLEELVRPIEADQRVGMCASKMLFYHQPQLINSAGISLDKVGIAWDRKLGEPETDADSLREVFGPCAGAALYRRRMLEEVGLFDEDFFCYLEDVDLAWRARLRGWRSLYVPGAKVYHLHSATSGEGSHFKSYLRGRNKVWTIIKNYPNPHLLLWSPVIALYDLGSVLFAFLAEGNLSPLRGRMASLRGLPLMLSKRFRIQKERALSSAAFQSHMSPVESPWGLYRRYRRLSALVKSRGMEIFPPDASGIGGHGY